MTTRVFCWIVSIFRHLLCFIMEPKDSLFEDAAISYGAVFVDRVSPFYIVAKFLECSDGTGSDPNVPRLNLRPRRK